jgi:hypothetical protein
MQPTASSVATNSANVSSGRFVSTSAMPSVWNRLAQVSVGHTLYAAFNWVFDNILYVYVVFTLGVFRGGTLMMTLSLLQCALTLLVYQRMRIDWVGAGWLADIKHKKVRSRVEEVLAWASNRHPALIFTALCLLQDPFITTAYFKQGRFSRLESRDWVMFLASVVASNVYWIFAAALIGQTVAALSKFISSIWM